MNYENNFKDMIESIHDYRKKNIINIFNSK